MPHFNNPIPRTGLPRFAESSSMRSVRDSAGTGRLWQKAARTTAQEGANVQAIRRLQQEVARLRRRIVGGSEIVSTTTSNTSNANVPICYQFTSHNGSFILGLPLGTHFYVTSASVNVAGDAYEVNNVLTLVGGTGTAATIRVANITGSEQNGPISAVSVVTAGDYTVKPNVPASATGGNGNGASFDLTFNEPHKIAKPYKLRYSIDSAIVDGQTITYNYSSDIAANYVNQQRTANCQSNVIKEVITPRYLAWDLIWACEPDHTEVVVVQNSAPVELTMIDMNLDGRAWAKKYDQS